MGLAYRVEHQCPQCGAPIDASENDRLLACPYCRVRFCLSFDDYPRYCLPLHPDLDPLLFVPYWRSKGILFLVHSGGIDKSLIDRTWNASRYPCFPESLGLRPRVLKLRLSAPDDHHRLLPVLSSPDEEPQDKSFRPSMGRDFSEEQIAFLFRTFLADAASIIYLPVFEKRGFMFDGIDSQSFGPVSSLNLNDTTQDNHDSGAAHCRFIPAICPNCGNDLTGDKDSVIVFCTCCTAGFSISGGAFHDIHFLVAPTASKSVMYLPFWRFHLENHGLPLPKTTGMILPGGRMEEFDKDNIFFWIPAFKVNPELFLRLARTATRAHLASEPADAMSVLSSIRPVAIPDSEAVKSVKLLFLLLSPTNREIPQQLNGLPVDVKGASIVLVPFEQKGYELTNGQMPASLHVNALNYGCNL